LINFAMAGAELLDDFDDCASLQSFQSCASRARRQRAVVKNTFVDIIDSDDEFRGGGRGMRRSYSDSDLSSIGDDGGDNMLGYWMAPSISSQSSVGSSRRDEFHWIGDRPYYGSRGGAGLDMIEVDVNPQQRLDDIADDDGRIDGSPGLTEKNLKKHERRAAPNPVPRQLPVAPVGKGPALVQAIYDELEGQMPMEKLQELSDEGQLHLIPRDENGALTSLGAIKHESGECFSCAYWFKGLCKYGISCNYCHMVHPGQRGKRLRPSRQTRMRMKKHEARKAEEDGTRDGDAAGSGNVLLDDDDSGIDDPGAVYSRPGGRPMAGLQSQGNVDRNIVL
jgi:hypothetical protein